MNVTKVPLYAKDVKIEILGNCILYTTDVVSKSPGIFLLADDGPAYDLVFANQIHEGSDQPITVKMKGTRIPGRKYEKNDRIGFLVKFE